MNNELVAQIVRKGLTQKQVAIEMGLNPRTFNNKLHRRAQANGNEAHFKASEKAWLSKRLNMDARLIK